MANLNNLAVFEISHIWEPVSCCILSMKRLCGVTEANYTVPQN